MVSTLRHILLALALTAPAIPAAAQTRTFAIVVEDGWYKAIDTTGRVVVDSLCAADNGAGNYQYLDDGMFPFYRNYRLGFKNHRNEVVVPPGYYPAGANHETLDIWQGDAPTETRFRKGVAVVRGIGGKFGMIDRQGRLVADTVYDYISAAEPATGHYAARRTDTLCILDAAGRNILPPAYRTDPKLYPFPKFREGLLCAMVRVGGPPYPAGPSPERLGHNDLKWSKAHYAWGSAHTYKVGFLNAAGTLVIDTACVLSNDMLGNRERDNDRFRHSGFGCGTSAANSGWRQPDPDPLYLADAWYVFRGGRCLVGKGRRGYVINLRGDSLYSVPPAYRTHNSDGFFILTHYGMLSTGYEYSIVNRQGKFLSPLVSFIKVDAAGHGYFLVQGGVEKNGKSVYYFIDSNGRNRTGRKFDIAYTYPKDSPFVEFSYANGDEKYLHEGRLDRNGKFHPVPDDDAPVSKIYNFVGPRSAGFSAVRTAASGRQLWGYLNARGEEVIAPRFKEALPFVRVEVGAE